MTPEQKTYFETLFDAQFSKNRSEQVCIYLEATMRQAIKTLVKEAVKEERQRCVTFLMNCHMQAGGKHNYYHVAANQLLAQNETDTAQS